MSEYLANLSVTVKVEFGDTTIDIMNRLLNALESKNFNIKEVCKENKENVVSKTKEENKVDKQDEKVSETIEASETEISLEQLRDELSKIREKGGKELIKKLLEYVGVNKLSDVKKEDYSKLMNKIKEVKEVN